jgi:hypothetical protein
MHHLPRMQNAYDKNQRRGRDIEVYEIRKRARQGSYSSLIVVVTAVVTTVARSSSIAAFASALSTSIRLFLAKSVVRPVVIIHLLRLREREEELALIFEKSRGLGIARTQLFTIFIPTIMATSQTMKHMRRMMAIAAFFCMTLDVLALLLVRAGPK